MPDPARRRFTMADLMILIAGCAVGMLWTKFLYGGIAGLFADSPIDRKYQLLYLVMLPVPSLSSLGMALVICRMLPPRPAFRRQCRQPGVVASWSMALMVALGAANLAAGRALRPVFEWIWPTPPGVSYGMATEWISLAGQVEQAGLVISACWLLLVALGRWRPEKSWIDRAGRCLGAGFIALYIASWLIGSAIP